MDSQKFKVGDDAYIVISHVRVAHVTIISISGEFYTVRFDDGGGTRIRAGRLYVSKEEALSILPKAQNEPGRNPWTT